MTEKQQCKKPFFLLDERLRMDLDIVFTPFEFIAFFRSRFAVYARVVVFGRIEAGQHLGREHTL